MSRRSRRVAVVALVAAAALAVVGCTDPGALDDTPSASPEPSPTVVATPEPSAEPVATEEPDAVPASIAALQPVRTEPFDDPSASSLGFYPIGQGDWLRQRLPNFHGLSPIGPTAVQVTGPAPDDPAPERLENLVPLLDMISDPTLSAAACEGSPGFTLLAVEAFGGAGQVSGDAWAQPGMEPVIATIAVQGPDGLEVRTGLAHAQLLAGDCAEPFVVDPVDGTPSSIVSSPGRWPIASLDDAAAVLASDDHQVVRVMLRTIRFLC